MNFLALTKSQGGQSSIEAAVMGAFMVVFVSAFLFTLYTIYASYWIEHIMYESLICHQERGSKHFCVRQAQDRIKAILVFNKAFKIKMDTLGSYSRTKLEMRIKPPLLEEKTFHFTKELRI